MSTHDPRSSRDFLECGGLKAEFYSYDNTLNHLYIINNK